MVRYFYKPHLLGRKKGTEKNNYVTQDCEALRLGSKFKICHTILGSPSGKYLLVPDYNNQDSVQELEADLCISSTKGFPGGDKNFTKALKELGKTDVTELSI